mmetsp:Transcript_17387/g.48873  ORF Transcript_17387/g.48873 Transcript_17387/m.48873 type:complete len:741 (+) Transcript_17387:1-2223(+)
MDDVVSEWDDITQRHSALSSQRSMDNSVNEDDLESDQEDDLTEAPFQSMDDMKEEILGSLTEVERSTLQEEFTGELEGKLMGAQDVRACSPAPHGPGVPRGRKSEKGRMYDDVFSGHDAVLWLKSKVEFSTRQCLELLHDWERDGLYSHVEGEWYIRDGPQLYRFHPLDSRFPLDDPKRLPEIVFSESQAKTLWERFSDPQNGVVRRSKSFRGAKDYMEYFSGCDAVNWLVSNSPVKINVEDALMLGQYWEQKSLFQHEKKERPFLNLPCLYCFEAGYKNTTAFLRLVLSENEEESLKRLIRHKGVGVPTQEMTRYKTKFTDVFVAKDAIDWVTKYAYISREDAVSLMRKWMRQCEFIIVASKEGHANVFHDSDTLVCKFVMPESFKAESDGESEGEGSAWESVKEDARQSPMGSPQGLQSAPPPSPKPAPAVKEKKVDYSFPRRRPKHTYLTYVCTALIIFPLICFSLAPHQEPRFLLPLLIPAAFVLQAFGFRVVASRNHESRYLRVLRWLWIGFNVVMVILYGAYHQGHVSTAAMEVGDLARGMPQVTDALAGVDAAKVHFFFVGTYMPPFHLIGVASSPWRGLGYEVHVHDLGGKGWDDLAPALLAADSPTGFFSATSDESVVESVWSIPLSLNTSAIRLDRDVIFVVWPGVRAREAMEPDVWYMCRNEKGGLHMKAEDSQTTPQCLHLRYSFTPMRTYRPHLNMENAPSLSSVLYSDASGELALFVHRVEVEQLF